jgi:VanZ family protein
LAGVVWGSLVPATQLESLSGVLPSNDKLVHYASYAGLGGLSLLSFARRRGILCALSMIPLGVLLEVFQHFSPGRTPEFLDAVANTLGVFSGIAVVILLTAVFSPRTTGS